MIPKERFQIAATRGIPDRVPAVYYGFGASQYILKQLGLNWSDIFWNGEKIAKVMIKAYDAWGHDNACSFLSAICGIDALGFDVYESERGDLCIRNIARLSADALDYDVPDPLRDGSMPERIKAAEILNQKFGNKLVVMGGFGGISTWAFFLRGAENFLRDSEVNRGLQHEYMSFITECAIEFCVAQVEAGCQWIISGEDAFASDLLGPEKCWECNGVYAARLANAIHKAGAGYILHCCGNTSSTIEKMADTGADVLSVNKIDLALAKKQVGDRVALMGNVKLDVFLDTPAHVEKECREAMAKAASNGGYLLSSGYIYPANTPYENVKAVVNAVKKYGQYV